MGKKVFANGMEIAHKAGSNKVIAAFPDVCMSPPSPPAGPVPLPYPDTSMAGDLEQGSKEVEIGGQPPEASGDSFGERELRSTDGFAQEGATAIAFLGRRATFWAAKSWSSEPESSAARAGMGSSSAH